MVSKPKETALGYLEISSSLQNQGWRPPLGRMKSGQQTEEAALGRSGLSLKLLIEWLDTYLAWLLLGLFALNKVRKKTQITGKMENKSDV